MVRVNWNKFQAKFGNEAQDAFEELSYLVFCREHRLKTGVFRFRNHPALETEPIQCNGEKIGFQAKFFTGKLSGYKQKILAAIRKVQTQYSGLNRLVFFLPEDFDYNSKAVDKGIKSTVKEDIEVEAKKTNLEIEWFCHSNFVATMGRGDYDDLGRFYFADERCVYGFIHALEVKTKQILSCIKTFINGSGVSFQIDRTKEIEELANIPHSECCVVYGEGGVGKSGLIKLFSEHVDICLVLSPNDVCELFNPISMETDWNTDLNTFFSTCQNSKSKAFVLDAAEKIEDIEDESFVFNVIDQFMKSGWQVIFTARNAFRQGIESRIGLMLDGNSVSIDLDPMSEFDLHGFAKQYNFLLPDEKLTRDFLRRPFYLSAYLKLANNGRANTASKFKSTLWNNIVAGGKPYDRAAEAFVHLIETRNMTSNYWLDQTVVEQQDIDILVNRGIVSVEASGQRLTVAHDIYEEWALERIIQRMSEESPPELFFKSLANSRPLIRAYRFWLVDKLNNGEDLADIVDTALSCKSSRWFSETIVALMYSSGAYDFLKKNTSRLLDSNADFLCRVVRIVLCACRTNHENRFSSKQDNASELAYYLAKPSGPGWKALIDFLYENEDRLHGFDLKDIVVLLHDWCQAVPEGDTTRKAGQLAFDFGSQCSVYDSDRFVVHHDIDELLVKTITASATQIEEMLMAQIKYCLTHFSEIRDGLAYNIVHSVLGKSVENLRFIKSFPDLTREMARTAWFALCPRGWSSFDWPETVFGLSTLFRLDYSEASAYKTPIFWLLQFDPLKTINFIVEIVNTAIENAAKSGEDIGLVKTAFTFPDGEKIEQYISNAVWCFHRGTGSPVSPYLLQSIHMALERFVLELHAECPECAPQIESLMLGAIKHSKSASIASVATSLVLAYPEEYFGLASVILTSRAAIREDFARTAVGEDQTKYIYSGFPSLEPLYQAERTETLKQNFRKSNLENVMYYYQTKTKQDLAIRKARMESLLDGYAQSDDVNDKFFVSRVDARKHKLISARDKDGQSIMVLTSVLSPELVEKQRETQDKTRPLLISFSLMHWADSKLNGTTPPDSCKQYEERIELAIHDFKCLLETNHADVRMCNPHWASYPAAAFLLFYRNQLDEETTTICKRIVLENASQVLVDNYTPLYRNGLDAAVFALPSLLMTGTEEEQSTAKSLLLAALLDGEETAARRMRICDLAFTAIRIYEEKEQGSATSFIGPYVSISKLFQQYSAKNKTKLMSCRNPVAIFWHDQGNRIFQNGFDAGGRFNDDSFDSMSPDTLMNAILLVPANRKSVCECRTLILASIVPALSLFYHYEKNGKLSNDRFSAAAIQYCRHLLLLLFSMEEEDLDRALKAIAQVPAALMDGGFLRTIIMVADQLANAFRFWRIWEGLFDPIRLEVSKKRYYERRDVMECYLLGASLWKKPADNWRCFDEHGVALFDRASQEFPASLHLACGYASFACSIGRNHWRECLRWIDRTLAFDSVDEYYRQDEVSYLVKLLERFSIFLVVNHKPEIRKNASLSKQAFAVLDYLCSNNSMIGYQLSELLT